MKNFSVLLIFLSLISCTKDEVFWVSPAGSLLVQDSDEGSSSSASSRKVEVEGKTINSKYTKQDAFSCLFEFTLGGGIIKTLFQAFTLGLDPVVDVRISKPIIIKIKSELQSYIHAHGKITPDDFWDAISESSQDELVASILRFNESISMERLFTHKQALGYAFLYFLEVEDESGVYKFTFDDRRANQYAGKFDYYVSFADSKNKKHAKEINSCNYFRFTDIDVNKYDQNLDKVRMCWDDQNYAKVSMDITQELRLSYSQDNLNYSEVFYPNDIKVDRVKDTTVFTMDYDFPKYEVGIKNKRNSEYVSIKRQSVDGERNEIHELKCRTIIDL